MTTLPKIEANTYEHLKWGCSYIWRVGDMQTIVVLAEDAKGLGIEARDDLGDPVIHHFADGINGEIFGPFELEK